MFLNVATFFVSYINYILIFYLTYVYLIMYNVFLPYYAHKLLSIVFFLIFSMTISNCSSRTVAALCRKLTFRANLRSRSQQLLVSIDEQSIV